MTVVGAYQAKTHLSQLLEKVIRGEIVQITKHGVPVAKLVPVDKIVNTRDTLEELQGFRKGKRLKGISLKELISEGRE